MNTFFIIKQLFIHSQIDEKVLSGDSLFFYVSVILFLKKERFTSDVSCNCIWFYCFYGVVAELTVSSSESIARSSWAMFLVVLWFEKLASERSKPKPSMGMTPSCFSKM